PNRRRHGRTGPTDSGGRRAARLGANPRSDAVPVSMPLESAAHDGRRSNVDPQLHGQIAAIRFASASRGWAALDNTPSRGTVEVRETSDGGMSWVTSFHTSTGDVYGLDAATINTAWLLT